jgi:membrane protease YdiL (CAAX protease family)
MTYRGVTVHVLGRLTALIALGVGVVGGTLVGGTVGGIVGVLIAMMGFQGLTLGVDGWKYVSAALATTGGLALIAWHHGVNALNMGLSHTTWLTGLIWSFGLIAGVGVVIGLAGRHPRTQPLFADERHDTSGVIAARRALLDIPFGTVLVEEFAFRGVMLALVTVLYGSMWAVVITSILFGLWHVAPAVEMHNAHQVTKGSPWPTILSTVLFTGIAGAGFAALRLFTGSLFPPAALHWASNGTGVIVGWFIARARRVAEVLDPEDGV